MTQQPMGGQAEHSPSRRALSSSGAGAGKNYRNMVGAVDSGGTKIAVGVVDEDGRLLFKDGDIILMARAEERN